MPDIYIHLFHGRRDPEEQLQDWGEDGPTIGPFAWAGVTYMSHWKFGLTEDGDADFEPTFVNDLLYYDGMLYGDVELITPGSGASRPDLTRGAQAFDPQKAIIPDEMFKKYSTKLNMFDVDRANRLGLGKKLGLETGQQDAAKRDPECYLCGKEGNVSRVISSVTGLYAHQACWDSAGKMR